MKKIPHLLCAALVVASNLPAQTEPAKPAGDSAPAAAPPSAPMDKVSYFIGSQIGGNISNSFKQQGIDIDVDAFLQAVRDKFEGKTPKFSEEELKTAMESFEAVMNSKAASQQQEAKAAGVKFLADNAKREGVTTTASGLQYEILKKGDGPKPVPTDRVRVHYHGTLVNGKVFDSSVDRGEPIVFGVQEVIKGWTEALQLMPVGSKWKIYLPSEIAYGEQGAGADIGPGETLIFEVELLEIVKG